MLASDPSKISDESHSITAGLPGRGEAAWPPGADHTHTRHAECVCLQHAVERGMWQDNLAG